MEKKPKTCPNCKAKNGPNARFCEKCGAGLNAVSNKVSDDKRQVCPACGAENKQVAKYCEKCGTSLNAQNISAQNGGRSDRGFGMQKNRWWILLIPIAAIAIFYLVSLLSAPSSAVSWNIPAGQNVTLPSGYYYVAYSDLSSTNTSLYGKVVANYTTVWVAGPSAQIYAFLNSQSYNITPIKQYVIENSTTATINITLPKGNYTVAFWGAGFLADNVIFPNGFNVTSVS